MDKSELIAELLQAINDDVQELKTWSQRVPTTPPPNYGPLLTQLVEALKKMQMQSQAPAQPSASVALPAVPVSAPINLQPLQEQLDRIERTGYQRPEYRLSQYVKYSLYGFGAMVVATVSMTWLALNWKAERDAFAVSDWKWRYVQQQSPSYAIDLDNQFGNEAQTARIQQWVIQQEAADATRLAARKAAQQAAHMNAQADELEGRPHKTSGQRKR